MPAGVETYLPGGTVAQIVSDKVYWRQEASGLLVVPAGPPMLIQNSLSITTAATRSDMPMLAVSSPEGCAYGLSTASGGQLVYWFKSRPGQTIHWRLFSTRRPPANASKAGLEIFDTTGGLVFASDTPILKPVASSQSSAITVPTGKSYMTVLNGLEQGLSVEIWNEDVGLNDWVRTTTQVRGYVGVRTVGSSLQFFDGLASLSSFQEASSPPPSYQELHYTWGQRSMLAIDVTGS